MSSQNRINGKSFFIRTFGCKVNQYESQAIRELMLDAGYSESVSKDGADIYIVNTCTVTSHSDKEARYVINLLHRTNPAARIVVTGCLANRGAEEVASLPGVSKIVRNEDKSRLAHILEGGSSSFANRDFNVKDDELISLKIKDFQNHSKAFLKIQDGCENFCAYCKVPVVRGPFQSKPIEDILDETRGLVENGFKEIILTGICLGGWGQDIFPSYAARGFGDYSPGLASVLKAIDMIPGDFRIRLSSIEPKYVTDELIEIMAGNKRICRHLHIPMQSGDDAVLRRMNRPYKASDYLNIIRKAQKGIPGIAITTDVMVGFPGEGDSNFRNTANLVKDINPLRVHIFKFSRREGTAAYNMGPVPAVEAVDMRYAEIEAIARDTSFIFRTAFLDRSLDVLVESKREKTTGFLSGYTDNYIKVRLEGPDSIVRSIVPVKITNIEYLSTTGTRLS